jgi:hypothetical protein
VSLRPAGEPFVGALATILACWIFPLRGRRMRILVECQPAFQFLVLLSSSATRASSLSTRFASFSQSGQVIPCTPRCKRFCR